MTPPRTPDRARGASFDVHTVLGHTCHVHIVFLVNMRWQSAIRGRIQSGHSPVRMSELCSMGRFSELKVYKVNMRVANGQLQEKCGQIEKDTL